jgi:dTMP kinase
MTALKIIALEGLDKSGKATQTKLLTERLRSEGYNVVQSEFHRYDTPTGELIMKWLRKEYDVDQTTIELIMAADKQAQQNWIKQLGKDDVDFLILDRYTLSQIVYSQASGLSAMWVSDLQENLLQPDLNIIIDIPAEESMRRKGKHNNGENDRYESDRQLLEEVGRLYRSFYTTTTNAPRVIINGVRDIAAIHEEIFTVVSEHILEGESTHVG